MHQKGTLDRNPLGDGDNAHRDMRHREPRMRLTEALLYQLVKCFYRSEVAHSAEMKEALNSVEKYDAYRATQIQRVTTAADAYGVQIKGQQLLDLGCAEGTLTAEFIRHGARHVIGVDIDAKFIECARKTFAHLPAEFVVSQPTGLPVPDASIDTIISFDVFEHVTRPGNLLRECLRVLKPGGQMLIGTWGWHNPFAPHLWATMPVPWAHVFFSERTILRTCRRVFLSDWYAPNQFDLDEHGQKKRDKYTYVGISTDYVNKYLLSDFEQTFHEVGFKSRMNVLPFSSSYASWTKPLLRIPLLREYLHSYFWAVLTKPEVSVRAEASQPVREEAVCV